MKKLKIWLVALACTLIACPAIIAHESSTPVSLDPTPFPCGKCKGKKTVTDIYGKQVICPKCKGSGTEPIQEEYKITPTKFPDAQCKKCKGAKGWNTTYGWLECDRCKGSGKEPTK